MYIMYVYTQLNTISINKRQYFAVKILCNNKPERQYIHRYSPGRDQHLTIALYYIYFIYYVIYNYALYYAIYNATVKRAKPDAIT